MKTKGINMIGIRIRLGIKENLPNVVAAVECS
jgi:hypothetical protein